MIVLIRKEAIANLEHCLLAECSTLKANVFAYMQITITNRSLVFAMCFLAPRVKKFLKRQNDGDKTLLRKSIVWVTHCVITMLDSSLVHITYMPRMIYGSLGFMR